MRLKKKTPTKTADTHRRRTIMGMTALSMILFLSLCPPVPRAAPDASGPRIGHERASPPGIDHLLRLHFLQTDSIGFLRTPTNDMWILNRFSGEPPL